MPKISPFAGLMAGLLAFYYAPEYLSAEKQLAIANALITFGATALGFLVNALAIFAALVTRDLFQRLIKTGHFRQLINELFWTGASFLLLVISSIGTLFVSEALLPYFTGVSVGGLIMSFVLLCSAGYHFYIVMANVR